MMNVQSRRLDELVLEALVVQPSPAARTSDSYLAMEIVADDADDDIAVTHRFVRASMPYERIELGSASSSTRIPRARRTTFVKTVKTAPVPAATLSFDKQWFEQPDDVIAATDDYTPPLSRATSWLWLGISLLAGAFAVGVLQYVL